MKMAALQLMQQKANRDAKAGVPAITETAQAPSESNADTTPTQTAAPESPSATEASADSTGPTESSASAASQAAAAGDKSPPKPTMNGVLEPAAAVNGECKSPLEGKELEESIPGLAQAKELAETLVAEDGSCIGTSERSRKMRG